MHLLFELFSKYYGIDWLTLGFGLSSSFLFSSRRVQPGLLCAAVACVGGFTVAIMSGQMGFIVYNALQFLINMRGIARGDRRAARRPAQIGLPVGQGETQPAVMRVPVTNS